MKINTAPVEAEENAIISCVVFILSLTWEMELITQVVQNQWASSCVMSCSVVYSYPLPPLL